MASPFRSERGASVGLAALCAVVLAALTLGHPTVSVVLLAGLLPTLVAFIVDWGDDKVAAHSVACMNLTGTFPFMPALAFHESTSRSLTQPLDIMTALITMYGAAACGWGLIIVFPTLADAIERMRIGRERKKLRDRQKRLVEEWGDPARAPYPAPRD